jgi:hypothetical protein
LIGSLSDLQKTIEEKIIVLEAKKPINDKILVLENIFLQ